MKISLLFATMALCVAVLQAAPGPVTIIDLPSGCDSTDERNNLETALTTAGNTVTVVSTGVVPADLSGNVQVWDIRCQNVLTGGEITTYTNYLVAGGSLFLMGENTSYGGARDASLISFIGTLGGGSLTLTSSNNAQTVNAPFTGPTAVTAINFRAVGGTTTSGTGAFVAHDTSDRGGAIAFSPGTLSSATAGTLIIVWDVNFLDNAATAAEQALTANLISYLAAPTPITGGAIPAPPSLILTLFGISGAFAYWLRRRSSEAV